MSVFAFNRNEIRCVQCKEFHKENYQIGICDFCFKEMHKPSVPVLSKNLYQEIDFYHPFPSNTNSHGLILLWLSYYTQQKTVKMWHSILTLGKTQDNNASLSPEKIFERYAKVALPDFVGIHEVICCKVKV
jgi:hypothetical protein